MHENAFGGRWESTPPHLLAELRGELESGKRGRGNKERGGPPMSEVR